MNYLNSGEVCWESSAKYRWSLQVVGVSVRTPGTSQSTDEVGHAKAQDDALYNQHNPQPSQASHAMIRHSQTKLQPSLSLPLPLPRAGSSAAANHCSRCERKANGAAFVARSLNQSNVSTSSPAPLRLSPGSPPPNAAITPGNQSAAPPSTMPFVANTPESLLGRSDSRDPSSTCRGITSSGRPCRRPIARAAALAPGRRPTKPDPSDDSLYCWQHKEQASLSTQSSPGPRACAQPILEERSSLDTLADRLGLVNLQEGAKEKQYAHAKVENGAVGGTQRPAKLSRPKPKQRLQCCFCFSIAIDEVDESTPPRPRPQPRPAQQAASVSAPSVAKPQKQQQQQQHIHGSGASPGKNSTMSKKSNASRTAQFKDLIPDTVDTATASALLAELSRPYADAEEAGYVYMFWLTPASKQTAPPVDAARSLLAPPSPARGAAGSRSRRPSDVVSQFADPSGTSGRSTMLLKIGRAANVQRRMNQWQRQCGYDIEMLRYYPYLPGASDASATGQVPRMTPHCRRVERLVHLELAGRGLHASLATCESCGRDHREWFQVEATREGIRAVDDVIRRWVEWDETIA